MGGWGDLLTSASERTLHSSSPPTVMWVSNSHEKKKIFTYVTIKKINHVVDREPSFIHFLFNVHRHVGMRRAAEVHVSSSPVP